MIDKKQKIEKTELNEKSFGGKSLFRFEMIFFAPFNFAQELFIVHWFFLVWAAMCFYSSDFTPNEPELSQCKGQGRREKIQT